MIRVLLVEDMALIRGALVSFLRGERDIDVVAALDCGEEAASTGRNLRPNVAVIDATLPGIDGLTTARQLCTAVPDCHAMIMTGVGGYQMLRDALEANVRGFVHKNVSPASLVDSIRRVACGERVLMANIAMADLAPKLAPLTGREREILAMAAEGASVPEMARRISLAAGTIRNNLSAVVTKLGARNRLDAVRIARDAGWI